MQTCSDLVLCMWKYAVFVEVEAGAVAHVRHCHLIADTSNVTVLSQLGSMETPDMFFIHGTPLAGSAASEKMRNVPACFGMTKPWD